MCRWEIACSRMLSNHRVVRDKQSMLQMVARLALQKCVQGISDNTGVQGKHTTTHYLLVTEV